MSRELTGSEYIRTLPPYPFARLDALRSEVEARGVQVIDLGLGDPRQETPDFIRDALIENVPSRSSYPRALGLDSLREAAASWLERRFEAEVSPGTEVLPTNGSKEALFTLPVALVDRSDRPLVLIPDPAYPVYELGVRSVGGEVLRLPLESKNGFLPDLDSVTDSDWGRASILWLNYPNNPTGAVAERDFYERAAARCREFGVILASDEAYSEIYFEDPPVSALSAGTENILVFHTLSKRSAMTGYRTGFMAGDARLIAMLKRIRPAMGVASPQFVQEAAVAAWNDEGHVDVLRRIFRRKRDLVLDGLRAAGLEAPPVPATFYVWLPVPGDRSSESFAAACLEAGVVVLPGTALGPAGEGFVRISLTAEVAELEEALARMRRLSL